MTIAREPLQDAPLLPRLDLREWLDRAEAMGELQRVDGVEAHLEMGALSHLNVRAPRHKALLFGRVPGYAPGFRVLTGSMTRAPRLGLTLRLGEGLDQSGLLAALDGKPLQWEREAPGYPVEYVADGPVCENILGPDDYDFDRFPAPLWHEHDGGRYFGTGCAVITAHPETGRINVGSYRMMLVDGKTLLVHINKGRHGLMNAEAWFQREGRCPIVASLGHDPLLFALACSEIPLGVSELEYAGAVMGAPVQALRGVTGLPVPAASEIVVEGWITPDRKLQEGPFGEWHGHYSGLRVNGRRIERLDPVIEVARVYHRHDPILLGSPPGRPPHDFTYFRSVVKSAMIKDALVKAGVPGVKAVWVYEAGGGRCFMVVSIRQSFFGHARQAGLMASQCPAGLYMGKYVIVVDDDIDPADIDQVIWALSFRAQPSEDLEVIHKSWGSSADPTIEDLSRPYNSRLIIDACIPLERRDDFPMLCEIRPELLEKVRARWSRLWEGGR